MKKEKINYKIVKIDKNNHFTVETIQVIVSAEVAKFLKEEQRREDRERKDDIKYLLPFHLGENEYYFSNYNKPHRHRQFLRELIAPNWGDKKQSREQEQKMIQSVLQALEQLTPKQRKRIELHFFKDLSIGEIAQIQGVNYSTVYRSIQKAIQNIILVL